MTYSFTRTREQLRDMVLRKLRVIHHGEIPPNEEIEVVYEAIDLRLKEIHRLGIFWPNVTKRPLSFTIPANTASASATVDILFPISMHVVDGSLDEPVALIGVREYAGIENKADTGVPEKALWLGGDEFVFWPVPTASTTAKLLYETIADDTAASTAPDVDVSMLRWLRDIIAYDIADEMGVEEQRIPRLKEECRIAEINIRKLASERTDYSTVVVDDFENSGRTETDYGYHR